MASRIDAAYRALYGIAPDVPAATIIVEYRRDQAGEEITYGDGRKEAFVFDGNGQRVPKP